MAKLCGSQSCEGYDASLTPGLVPYLHDESQQQQKCLATEAAVDITGRTIGTIANFHCKHTYCSLWESNPESAALFRILEAQWSLEC